MPDFRFLGFNVGTPVTMSLRQGAVIRGPLTIPAWAQPVAGGGTGEVAITTQTDGSLVAPTGVWFQAVIGDGFLVTERQTGPNTYDPSFHEIDYVWTITRPAGAASTFSTPLNMPTVWNNRNNAYGKQVAFVMDVPGDYTVTCTARDWAGNTGTATWTQTVIDPDAAFPGPNTICFDAAGVFAGAPGGAQTFSDIELALNALRTRPGDARFLFRRGTTYDYPDRRTPIGNTGAGFLDNNVLRQTSNLRFGAFGTGERPILRPIGDTTFVPSTSNDTYGEITVYGLDFQGPWDAATETGLSVNCIHAWPMTCHILAHDCRFSGFNIALSPSAQTGPFNQGRGRLPTTILSETVITNWQNMGIFTQDSNEPNLMRLAFTGCSIYQKPDALGGRFGDKKTSNAHGPIRYSSGQLYLGACEFFSIGGWSASGSAAGGVADQPCLRIISTGASDDAANQPFGDFYTNCERIVAEGGGTIISHGATRSNGGGLHVPMNHLIDRFITIGTAKSVTHVGASSGGTTLRNGLLIQPANESRDRRCVAMIQWGPNNNAGEAVAQANYQERQAVHNVTGIFLRTAAQNENQDCALLDQSRVDLWQSKVVENNLFHAPNQGTPVTGDGPFLSQLLAGFTPRYIGDRYNFPFIPERTGSGPSPTVPNGGTLTFPYPAGTNQAHFTANPIGPKSCLAFQENLTQNIRRYAQLGEFTITFTSGGIVVTNTSGAAWDPAQQGGASPKIFQLSLDRSSELPAPLASGATPADLPVLWTPAAGSPAIGAGDQGARTRDDVLLRARATPRWRGAVQPG